MAEDRLIVGWRRFGESEWPLFRDAFLSEAPDTDDDEIRAEMDCWAVRAGGARIMWVNPAV